MQVKFRDCVCVSYDLILTEIALDLTVDLPCEGRRMGVSMTADQTDRLIGLLQRARANFPPRKSRKKKA